MHRITENRGPSYSRAVVVYYCTYTYLYLCTPHIDTHTCACLSLVQFTDGPRLARGPPHQSWKYGFCKCPSIGPSRWKEKKKIHRRGFALLGLRSEVVPSTLALRLSIIQGFDQSYLRFPKPDEQNVDSMDWGLLFFCCCLGEEEWCFRAPAGSMLVHSPYHAITPRSRLGWDDRGGGG